MWQKLLVSLGIELISRMAGYLSRKISSLYRRIMGHKKTDGINARRKELKAQLKALMSNKELSKADKERLILETKKDLANIQRDSITDYEL